jgi:retron-type reverse transcriptase
MSNFTLQINEAEIRKEAEKFLRDKIQQTLRNETDLMFREKNTWDSRSVDGPARQMIQERLAIEFLSEKSKKIMDAYFEANWEKILQEAMEKAMRKAAEHKANQLAFSQAGLKNSREKRESYLDQMFDSDHIKNGA